MPVLGKIALPGCILLVKLCIHCMPPIVMGGMTHYGLTYYHGKMILK